MQEPIPAQAWLDFLLLLQTPLFVRLKPSASHTADCRLPSPMRAAPLHAFRDLRRGTGPLRPHSLAPRFSRPIREFPSGIPRALSGYRHVRTNFTSGQLRSLSRRLALALLRGPFDPALRHHPCRDRRDLSLQGRDQRRSLQPVSLRTRKRQPYAGAFGNHRRGADRPSRNLEVLRAAGRGGP